MEIRDAGPADVDGIAAIYNDAVANTTAIWNETIVDAVNRRAWLADRQRAGYPVIVAIDEGGVLGYASFGDWRAFDGYRHTVEHSVYVRLRPPWRRHRQGADAGADRPGARPRQARDGRRHRGWQRRLDRPARKLGFEHVGLMPRSGPSSAAGSTSPACNSSSTPGPTPTAPPSYGRRLNNSLRSSVNQYGHLVTGSALIPTARYSDSCAAAAGARPGICGNASVPDFGRRQNPAAAAPAGGGRDRRVRRGGRTRMETAVQAATPLPSALTRSGQRPGRSRASACRAEPRGRARFGRKRGRSSIPASSHPKRPLVLYNDTNRLLRASRVRPHYTTLGFPRLSEAKRRHGSRRPPGHDARAFGVGRSRCGTRTWLGIRGPCAGAPCARGGWRRSSWPRRERGRGGRGAGRAFGG